MNYKMTKEKLEQYRSLMKYLKSEGFTVGRTRTGFIAVDAQGVVFECSPWRTYGSVRHLLHSEDFVERVDTKGIALASWFTTYMDYLRKWRVDPEGVVEIKILRKVVTK